MDFETEDPMYTNSTEMDESPAEDNEGEVESFTGTPEDENSPEVQRSEYTTRVLMHLPFSEYTGARRAAARGEDRPRADHGGHRHIV